MIVEKAVKMAEIMNIPIIGIVENMSYFKCPDCNKDYKIFGDSKIEEEAKTRHRSYCQAASGYKNIFHVRQGFD